VVNLEQLPFKRCKAQASFEFIIILAIILLSAAVFILAVTDEYADSFILSSVKNLAELEISKVALSYADCANTTLVKMNFLKKDKVITLNISGCRIDVSKISGVVETKLCGMPAPSGGAVIVCGSTVYTINQV